MALQEKSTSRSQGIQLQGRQIPLQRKIQPYLQYSKEEYFPFQADEVIKESMHMFYT